MDYTALVSGGFDETSRKNQVILETKNFTRNIEVFKVIGFGFVKRPSSESCSEKIIFVYGVEGVGNITAHRTHTKHQYLNVYGTLTFYRHVTRSGNTSIA
jgi:hypothetical protein